MLNERYADRCDKVLARQDPHYDLINVCIIGGEATLDDIRQTMKSAGIFVNPSGIELVSSWFWEDRYGKR